MAGNFLTSWVTTGFSRRTLLHGASLEAFTVVKIQVEVFWAVTPCNVVVGYRCFRGPCSLHIQGEVKWRWRQHGPPNCLYPTITLHGVTIQKTLAWTCSMESSSSSLSTYVTLNTDWCLMSRQLLYKISSWRDLWSAVYCPMGIEKKVADSWLDAIGVDRQFPLSGIPTSLVSFGNWRYRYRYRKAREALS
jgi:hypothetical protein